MVGFGHAGLEVEDRIELALSGDADLVQAAHQHRDYLAGETLAVALQLEADSPAQRTLGYVEEADIEGRPLTISLRLRRTRAEA